MTTMIAIEGTDGTGKQTLVAALMGYMEKRGYPTTSFSFPRYDTPTGKIVRAYLKGEFGNPTELDPYFVAPFYAIDRWAANKEITDALMGGKNILLDRYVDSNKAHQGAKIYPDGVALSRFLEWLDNYEYTRLGIAKQDLTICLNLHPEHSLIAMKNQGREQDGHESNIDYQEKVARTYQFLGEKGEENWYNVECIIKNRRKTVDEIVEEVFPVIRNYLD